MNVWLEFVVALLFIGACIATAAAMIGDDLAAAIRELIVDALWDDDEAIA